MEKIELQDGIFMIKDFLTEEEAAYLNKISVEAEDDVEQWQESLNNSESFWHDKVMRIPNQKMMEDIYKRAEEHIDPSCRLSDLTVIQRLYTGSFLKYHHDSGYTDDLKYALVIYINDNYVGGELHFPDRDLEIRVPARALVTFPSGPDYEHGVKEVLEGPTRYVVPSFAFIRK